MELFRISIPKDDVWKVIKAIGEFNFAHFIDLNKEEKVFNLPYAFRIKMCEETERRIAYLLTKSREMRITCTRPKDLEVQEKAAIALADQRQTSVELLIDNIEKDII